LEILPQVLEAASDHNVTLVFGNEKNGLSNHELKLCHLSTVLPTSPGHASLNLSHAVAIAAFLIFNQTPESVLQLRKPERFYATQEELEDLMSDFKAVLEALDYRDTRWNDLLTRTLNNLSRLFKKAGLERREFHLFKAFLSRVAQRMENDYLRAS
jgi:tRNA C32,U32 (ribose-2'-O)-methylase TrmJ